MVYREAPDLASLVLAGTKPLYEAYAEARQRRAGASSDEAKMVQLHK
jgi:hypothetical protein